MSLALLAAFEFAHPAALLLCFLPAIVLWFARKRAARPHADATGTIEIWQRSAALAPHSGAKARIPPSLWCAALALVCGALALAAPRTQAAALERTLLVVVDRSPSMYLKDGGRTRLEHALERPAALGFERVRWIAPPLFDDETRAPSELPHEWLAPPRFPVGEPDFSSFDRESTLFVTDRALADVPRHAGFSCSGGAAVPGPIGVDEDRLVVWDGTRLVAQAGAESRKVVLETGLSERLQRMARAWAGARGLTVVVTSNVAGPSSALTLFADRGARSFSSDLGRDGWSARAECSLPLPLRDAFGPLACWLRTPDNECIVAHAAGRIHTAFSTIDEPRGDPAAWAVSWSQLFDEALALPSGCVSLAERSAAGEPAVRDPRSASGASVDSGGPWTAIVAGTAAFFALAALLLGLSAGRERAVAVP